MPLLKGMTLHAAIKANPRPPLNEVIRIGREVAEGLAAAHEKGLVHRDIKPANVWLEGKKLRVKVLDFGLARIADTETESGPLTREGAVVGTPSYMSPEQGRGLAIDGRTDLWSLGVMLYQMTTGELPFRGATQLAILTSLALDNPPPPIAANPGVPQALSDFVMRLLAKDPAYRPPTAEVAAEELRAIEAGLVNAVRVIALDSPPPIILSNAGPDPFADLDATEVNSTPETEAVEEPDAVDEPAKSRGGFPMWAIVAGVLLAVTLIVGIVASQMGKKPVEVTKEEPPTLTPTPKEKPLAPGDLLVLKYGSNPAVEMKFRWIPPGKFTRGNPEREITISKGFWMAETECTQAQWRAIMKARPDPSAFKGDNLPVEQVSATDADEFCKELATLTRKPMRLPSEAEWEYACRAGTKTEYHSGDGEDALKKAGWYGGNSGGKTRPVGELAANLWGLRDMHGNVWEWCQDGYEADYYGKSPATDPLNTNNQTNDRVIRGGSGFGNPDYCLAAYRGDKAPGNRDCYLGFRVCFRSERGGGDSEPGKTDVDAPNRWENAINLLPLIDPAKDAVASKFVFDKDGALATDSADAQFAGVEVPYRPAEEYDYRIRFTPTECPGGCFQFLVKAGTGFSYDLGAWGNKIVGFQNVDGNNSNVNRTTVQRESWLRNGREYVSTIQVRKDTVKAFLDGVLVTQWQASDGPLSTHVFVKLRDSSVFGVGNWTGRATFHSVEVLEVTGRSTFTRADDPAAKAAEAKRAAKTDRP